MPSAEACGEETKKGFYRFSIHASSDNGVTSIDTAPFYGFGLSEEPVGEAIKDKDCSIQLLTKFRFGMGVEATKARRRENA